ncbi:hypothetical protein RQP46_001982 [Phenoliferia psychrophenolica]
MSTAAAVDGSDGLAPPLPPLLPLKNLASITHTSHHGDTHHRFEGPLEVVDMDYERLEHYGDSVLHLSVTSLIREMYPGLTPGGATLVRGALVSNLSLAGIAVEYGLHLRVLGAPSSIRFLERTQAALFEAYLGGMADEHGLETAMTWCQAVFRPRVVTQYALSKEAQTPIRPPSTNKRARSMLEEWSTKSKKYMKFETDEGVGPQSDRMFSCTLYFGDAADPSRVKGTGRTKKEATHAAAQKAADELELEGSDMSS